MESARNTPRKPPRWMRNIISAMLEDIEPIPTDRPFAILANGQKGRRYGQFTDGQLLGTPDIPLLVVGVLIRICGATYTTNNRPSQWVDAVGLELARRGIEYNVSGETGCYIVTRRA